LRQVICWWLRKNEISSVRLSKNEKSRSNLAQTLGVIYQMGNSTIDHKLFRVYKPYRAIAEDDARKPQISNLVCSWLFLRVHAGTHEPQRNS
jgi:hypothetical protein